MRTEPAFDLFFLSDREERETDFEISSHSVLLAYLINMIRNATTKITNEFVLVIISEDYLFLREIVIGMVWYIK